MWKVMMVLCRSSTLFGFGHVCLWYRLYDSQGFIYIYIVFNLCGKSRKDLVGLMFHFHGTQKIEPYK
jgi:hypothetical protein